MTTSTKDDGVQRNFSTGATRDTGEGKLDFEGFLHPLFIEQFAKYMNMHRLQSDGTLRDSDNWQKGIPQDVCMKSAFRHFFEFWKAHRTNGSYHDLVAAAMGLMFNIQAYLLPDLQSAFRGMVDFDGTEPTDEMRDRQEKLEKRDPDDICPECYDIPCTCGDDTLDDPHCANCVYSEVSLDDYPCYGCGSYTLFVRR